MVATRDELSGFSSPGRWQERDRRGQRTWFGTLIYSPIDGVNIDIQLAESTQPYPKPAASADVIHWTAVDGQLYSAVHAYFIGSTSYFGGGETQRAFGNYLLSGAHLPSRTAPFFGRLVFRSASLIRWAEPKNIQVKRKLEPDHCIVARYQSPGRVDLILNTIGTAKIWWSPLAKLHAGSDGEYRIEEQAAIEFEFEKVMSFDEVLNLTYALEFYFAFAANLFTGPPECNLVGDQQSSQLVRLLLHQSWYKPMSDHDPHKEYFRLSDVANTLTDSLSSWITAFKSHAEPLTAYFQTRTHSENLQAKVLYLAQAVEALSRRLFPLAEPTDQERRRLQKILTKAVRKEMPDDFRKRFGSRIYPDLRELGRATFRERLLDVAERFQPLIDLLCPQFKELVPHIVRWRNDLTHRNPTEPLSQDIAEILFVCRDALRLCVDMIIFRLMHVPNQTAERALAREFAGSFTKWPRVIEQGRLLSDL
jgi:hypothetical protein